MCKIQSMLKTLIFPIVLVPFVPKRLHEAGAGPSLYQGCLPN